MFRLEYISLKGEVIQYRHLERRFFLLVASFNWSIRPLSGLTVSPRLLSGADLFSLILSRASRPSVCFAASSCLLLDVSLSCPSRPVWLTGLVKFWVSLTNDCVAVTSVATLCSCPSFFWLRISTCTASLSMEDVSPDNLSQSSWLSLLLLLRVDFRLFTHGGVFEGLVATLNRFISLLSCSIFLFKGMSILASAPAGNMASAGTSLSNKKSLPSSSSWSITTGFSSYLDIMSS